MRTFSILLMGLVGSWPMLLAQTIPPPPNGLKSQINYTVEDLSYYRIPQGIDSRSMDLMDLQKTKLHRTVKSVEQRVQETGEYSSTILILNPEEVYSQWPEAIGRLEIDQTGTRTYRTDGTLFNTLPASAEDLATYASIRGHLAENGLNIQTAFPMPDASTLNILTNEGWTVQTLSEGAIHLANENTQLLLEPAYMRNTTFTYQGAELQEKRIEAYLINSQGILAPAYVRTEKREIMPSGACMERIHHVKYTAYSIAATSTQQRNAARASAESILSISPNPASDFVQIVTGTASHRLIITDALGKTIWETVDSTEEKVEISVANWPAGFYFVSLSTAQGQQTMLFVKRSP